MKNNLSLIIDIKNLISNCGFLMIMFLIVQTTLSNTSIHVYIKDLFCVFVLIEYVRQYSSLKYVSGIFIFSIINFSLMGIYGIINSNFELLSMLLGPLAYFLFGFDVVMKSRSERDLCLFLFLIIISSSLFLWIHNIQDSLEVGIINTNRILSEDLGISVQSATLQGLIASIGISGIAYPIAYSKYLGTKSLLFIASSFLSLFCVIHLVDRAGLLVFVIVSFVTAIYSTRNKKAIIWFIVFLIMLYFVTLHILRNDEISSAYENREYYSSISSGGLRFVLWKNSFTYMFEYPFGWFKIDSGYSHNLWLDVARCIGIFPFLLFVIITFQNYKNTFRLFKLKDKPFNGLLIGMQTGLFVAAFMEPVLESVSTIFYLICLFWGVQFAYLHKKMSFYE